MTHDSAPLSISLADVTAARERLRQAVSLSPCPHSRLLSALTGREIYLKLENLQMTGSFKERGALNRICHADAGAGGRGAWWRPAPATTRRAWRTTPRRAASAP